MEMDWLDFETGPGGYGWGDVGADYRRATTRPLAQGWAGTRAAIRRAIISRVQRTRRLLAGATPTALAPAVIRTFKAKAAATG